MKKLNNNFSNISVGNNFLYKILSFVLAVILWLLVTYNLNPEYEKTFSSVEIKYENFGEFNDGFEIMNQVEKTVDVTVSGKRNDIIKLNSENIYAYIDFTEVNADSKKLPVKVRPISSKVAVLGVSEEYIDVVIDKKITKVFPIEIHQIGKLKGEVWPEFVLEEKLVKVTGPSSEINKIKEVAAIIDVSDVKDGKITECTLEVIPKSTEVGEIRVDIKMKSVGIKMVLYTKKELEIIPNFVGEPDGNIKLVSHTLSSDKILVSGPLVKLNKANYVYTEDIDLSSVSRADGKIEDVKLDLSPPLKAEADDLTIALEFDEEINKTLVVDVNDVDILNVPKSAKAVVLSPKNIEFELLGYSRVLEKIKPNDMIVELKIPTDFIGKKELFYSFKFKADVDVKDVKVSKSTEKLTVRVEKVDE